MIGNNDFVYKESVAISRIVSNSTSQLKYSEDKVCKESNCQTKSK